MSDPAIEAANRAAVAGRLMDDLMIPGLSVRAFGEDAAREALAPIRELHKPRRNGCGPDDCETCSESAQDWREWPCDTARLIYTTEELNR